MFLFCHWKKKKKKISYEMIKGPWKVCDGITGRLYAPYMYLEVKRLKFRTVYMYILLHYSLFALVDVNHCEIKVFHDVYTWTPGVHIGPLGFRGEFLHATFTWITFWRYVKKNASFTALHWATFRSLLEFSSFCYPLCNLLVFCRYTSAKGAI